MINIDEKLLELSKKCEEEVQDEFKKIDNICEINSLKVLNAFHEENVSEAHFNLSTGYGYNDLGRDKIEEVYKKIFKCYHLTEFNNININLSYHHLSSGRFHLRSFG